MRYNDRILATIFIIKLSFTGPYTELYMIPST